MHGVYFGTSVDGNGLVAGPLSTAPVGANLDPWQGQSQTRSRSFHVTSQPRCVQTLLSA